MLKAEPGAHQAPQDILAVHAQLDPLVVTRAVATQTGKVFRCRGRTVAPVDRASGQHPRRQQVGDCEIDVFAFAGATGTQHGSQDCERGRHARTHIPYQHSRMRRLLTFAERECTCVGLVVVVVPGHIRQRPELTKAGERAEHDRWIRSAERVEANPQAIGHTGAEPFDHHFRFSDMAQQSRPVVRVLQIEHGAALVAVPVQITITLRAHPVAARGFGLQHVGTKVGKQLRGDVARLPERQVDDLQPVEQTSGASCCAQVASTSVMDETADPGRPYCRWPLTKKTRRVR
ncbi:unannotated protein [freshwater metagenome]|uniref:Unannotated protein n=1 Tax=freshwater metagenome TaxID=449393 RepID=A0A6J7C218_9ZZZZ